MLLDYLSSVDQPADVRSFQLISQRAECKGLQSLFFGEAKMRLELEHGRASLTTLQALVVLCLHEAASGRDRIGRVYHLQMMDLWHRLGFDCEKSRPYDCEESELARSNWRATTLAAWGIFCTQKLVFTNLPFAVSLLAFGWSLTPLDLS
jgi:hypothetical protein